MKKYKNYQAIPSKYKFDLDYLLEGKSFELQFKKLIKRMKIWIANKDSKYVSKEFFLKTLNYQDNTQLIFNKLVNYIFNNIATNVVDAKFVELSQKVEFELFQLNKELGSEFNRMIKHQKVIQKWINDKKFDAYRKGIQTTFENKKYKLSNEIEEFIIKIQRADINTADVFTILNNSELDYGYAISSTGKKTKISRANRMELLKNSDEEIRKTTQQNWIKASIKHKQTFSNLLFQHFKSVSTWASTRNHKSTINSLIYEDRANVKLLETIYSQVQKYTYLFRKHNNWSKRFFKKKFNKKKEKWDHHYPIVKVKENYTIEEMQELVLKATKPLGKEYNNKVKEAFVERWIDYFPVQNKQSGAYSIDKSYGLDKKYILMNFDGTLRSVATLAHEIGHSMHSYYSDKHQPISLSEYPIFLAEIASIFNELMLNDYLINNSNDDELKFKLLDESISDFEGTVRRQAMWSNYEFDLYSLIEKGKPLSNFEAISKVYKENALKYAIDNTKYMKDEETIAAVTVPHFYYNFYVYKYSIGYIVANVFFQRYKENGIKDLENYIQNFLSVGNRDWPIQILKDAKIDLYNESIYQQAFKVLDIKINEYIKLGKKIFKI